VLSVLLRYTDFDYPFGIDTKGIIKDTKGVIKDTKGVIKDTKGVVKDTKEVIKDTKGVIPTKERSFFIHDLSPDL
jgi:hypothetical protein